MTEAEIAAARKRVLQTVRQTRLGRSLLAALGKAQVKIVFSTDVNTVAGLARESNVKGFYDPRSKTLYVDAAMPLHAQLHFFAHEARHALQMEQERKINREAKTSSVHLISPVTHLYLTRLREIDADVFAVCFVAKLDLDTGSDHSNKMRERSGFFFMTDPYSRAGLYDAFIENWREQEAPRDMARAARAVVVAFVKNTELLNTYNNFSLHIWEKMMWNALFEHAQKPATAFYKDFSAAAQKKDNVESPRDIFNSRAAAYSNLLVKSGAPDYLSGIKVDDLTQYICEENTEADPWQTTNYAYERAIDRFGDAVKHYAAAPEKPANAPAPNVQTRAGRKR